MRVVDLIKSTDNTAFSFEILPPLKGTGIENYIKRLIRYANSTLNILILQPTAANMCTKSWETGCTNVHASAAVPEQLLLPPLCRTNTI